MKAILTLLMLVGLSAFGQDYYIKFFPDNQPYVGMTNWPKAKFNTNTVPAPDFDVVTNLPAVAAIMKPQQAIYDAGVSNDQAVAKAKADANLAKIVALFNQIPSARGTIQNISTNATSGTAVANLKQACVVMGGILEMFQRLLPELRDQYDGSRDTTP